MSLRPSSSLLLALLAAAMLSPAHGEDGRDLIEVYCYDCHGDGRKKGDISLEDLITKPGQGDGFAWHKAWKIARHELMPPADEDQPTAEERATITRWIAANRLGVDLENPDPGRVTTRRLNRMEYQYTITDLFGVELRQKPAVGAKISTESQALSELLPPDDQAFGFDNIGDFLSLSPALLDKYFELAEFVASEVVSLDGPAPPEEVLTRDINYEENEESFLADHDVTVTVEHAGTYELDLRFRLGGWRGYGGSYQLKFSVGDETIATRELKVGGDKNHHLHEEIDLEPGEHRISITTEPNIENPEEDVDYLRLRPRLVLTGPMDPAHAVYPEPHRKIFFDGPAPEDEAARSRYAREILKRLADRAFRRPVPEATLDRLTGLALTDENFEAGIAEAITAILVSPQFLFRTELQPQPNDPATVHPLDDHALASRLSYFLWLSIPDGELTSLAARGELRNHLDEQLERMLADSRTERFLEDFPGQWLRTRNVLSTPVSSEGRKKVAGVRSRMKMETEMLFEHIARDDADLLELITADYTFLNESLAGFYGIEGVEGHKMRKVDLPEDSRRGGILTHGSFLVSTSNPNRTSPVKRGLFVLENLLGIEPPPPPPDIPTLEEARTGEGREPRTVREQLELHREDKSCASCHAHFDPIGLVLENYDLIGQWREDENGDPIVVDEKTASGQPLTGIEDVRAYFKVRQDLFYRCVTEKLLTYALGRGLEPADTLLVDATTDKLIADGGKFSVLVREIVHSPAFLTRRGDDGKIVEPPRVHIPKPPEAPKRKKHRFDPEEFPDARKAAEKAAEEAAKDKE